MIESESLSSRADALWWRCCIVDSRVSLFNLYLRHNSFRFNPPRTLIHNLNQRKTARSHIALYPLDFASLSPARHSGPSSIRSPFGLANNASESSVRRETRWDHELPGSRVTATPAGVPAGPRASLDLGNRDPCESLRRQMSPIANRSRRSIDYVCRSDVTHSTTAAAETVQDFTLNSKSSHCDRTSSILMRSLRFKCFCVILPSQAKPNITYQLYSTLFPTYALSHWWPRCGLGSTHLPGPSRDDGRGRCRCPTCACRFAVVCSVSRSDPESDSTSARLRSRRRRGRGGDESFASSSRCRAAKERFPPQASASNATVGGLLLNANVDSPNTAESRRPSAGVSLSTRPKLSLSFPSRAYTL